MLPDIISSLTEKTTLGTLLRFQIKDEISEKITKITYFRRLTEELQNMIRETYTIPNTKKKVYDRMTGSLKQGHRDSSSKNPVTNRDNQTRKPILISNNLKL